MNKIIAKIKVASHSGLVTALVCLAQPTSSFASDIELYRPPQDKDMTLMFMLDVSGSMSDSGSYDGTPQKRIERLKAGMLKLLQGDPTDGTQPLPDKLVAGLSEFSATKGRIKLEARPLGEAVAVGGVRELYKTTQVTSQLATRTQTRQKTDETWKEINQTQTQTCSWGRCTWSAWSPSETSATTSWASKNNSGSYGSATTNPPTLIGSPTPTGSVIAHECTGWKADNTTCKTWVSTTKQPTDFASATPTSSSADPVPGTWTNVGAPTPITAAPVGPLGLEPQPVSLGKCFFGLCENNSRIVKKDRTTITTTETQVQTTTVSSTTTVVYTGASYTTHRQRMIDAVSVLSATGFTPTAFAYAEVAAYMMGQTTKNLTSGGFNSSTQGQIRDADTYLKPAQVDRTKQCNAQGIYFLTDGQPNYSDNPGNYTSFMKSTLGSEGGSFDCSGTPLFSNSNSWSCIGNYAKALLDPTKNPAGVEISTAVVGFGSDFNEGATNTSNDVKNAKQWGVVGKGGWYSASSASDIVKSVNDFINKLNKYIPSVTVGSATIPIDALDTQNVQPWAYFPQFDPKPSNSASNVITWLGNVKKYKTLNNSLVDRGNTSVLENTGLLKDDTNDFWADTSITKVITKEVGGVKVESTVKVGGALSQLILGYDSTKTPSERRIFTNRKIVVDPNDASANIVSSISSGDLKQLGKADFISSSTNKFKEDPKRGYILSLFGYNVNKSLADDISISAKDANSQTQLEQLLTSTANLRQMGAVMHSRPVLLTQSGKTKFVDDVLTYDKRDDLILFGTTQGVLHVVKAGETGTDSNAGKELFSFVPNEMIENQSQAFLNQDSQSGTLGYGVDGQWTAYTEYVTKKGSSATDEPVVTVKGGKQWVYGGLRMGGRSYYSLDLTDVSSTDNASAPKLKFHINPTGEGSSTDPLGYMGQSWSKPTIASVNWKGKRKLVMFVGGGYDMGYEAGTYDQDKGNKGNGAGVYMFDANNGDLLWWSSSNPSASSNAEDGTNALKVDDMKYSVVSQIKTVDRNNDGLVDHLYFGDLGGQVWRVDIDNNQKSKTEAFAKRAVKLLDLHKVDGTSARFYTTPSFTIHNGGTSGLFAAVSIGSGDLSSPMSAPNSAGKDAIYVIYDKDVVKANLYQLPDTSLVSKNMTIGTVGNTLASNTNGNTKTDLTRGGWYYPLSEKLRVLNDSVAIDSDLYVSVFDASKDIDALSCAGGVRGESNVEQFCLPYGNCTKIESGQPVTKTRPVSIFLGKGNIGVAFGGTTGESSSNRSLVVNVKKDNPTFTNYAGNLKLVSQRWYEKYAKAS